LKEEVLQEKKGEKGEEREGREALYREANMRKSSQCRNAYVEPACAFLH